jgi:uncharacterized membrane protein YphA (DoxX/SURF4 family)
VIAQAFAAIALGLRAVAGIAKLTDPDPTSGALEAARLPAGRSLARAIGIIEVLSATLGLAIGGLTVLPAAVLYLGFTLFTLSSVLNRRPIQSCGCFGRDDTPPSSVHVVYNSVATLLLGYVVIADIPVIRWSASSFELLAYLGYAAIGAYASYLLLSVMPQTLKVAKSP